MAKDEFRVFVSAVSSELKSYREEVARVLTRKKIKIRIQEYFQPGPATLIETLDVELNDCDAAIFLIGDRAGFFPFNEPATLGDAPAYNDYRQKTGQERASYTQWEFMLAKQKNLHTYVFLTAEGFEPDGPDTAEKPEPESQRVYREWIERSDKHWSPLTTREKLVEDVLVLPFPDLSASQPRNLPFASLGELFKGRDEELAKLHEALSRGAAAVAGKALHGLGGVGKTRLAIEYAHRYAEHYSALLFVPADTPDKLDAGLAALAAVLDLPEQDAREEDAKIHAVLQWLDAHDGWLVILDNVDDAVAAEAGEAFIDARRDGHVLITGRHPHFSVAIETFELDALPLDDAAAYLLDATKQRERAADDAALARELAKEVGGLALALAQAGAYIERQRIGFSRYLKLWRETREKVLNWFNPRLVSYNHDVGLAATWATSVEKLTPQGRFLLELCAFLDPAPIPKFLLDIEVPSSFETAAAPPPQDEGSGAATEGLHPEGGAAPSHRPHPEEGAVPSPGPHPEERAMLASRRARAVQETYDAYEALADLFAYSLAANAEVEAGKTLVPGFAVHRLVQDFTRRRIGAAREREAIERALNWVDAAFEGDPADVRTWPVLDPLAPHALSVSTYADAAQIAGPTSRLMNDLGRLLDDKARHREAEPLYARALAIDEKRFGPDHPRVAAHLNNLALLLSATNRRAEAEPLIRRALAIDEKSYGPDHPEVAIRLNNLALLLSATNRRAEAAPLYARALAIKEKSFGRDHPRVATVLNNLAELLRASNRHREAEPLIRRVVSIFEKSLGAEHPNVATALSSLAGLLYITNRFAEAEPLFRRVFSIFEKSLGAEHPNVATALNNLANLLSATNRLAEAEPLHARALAIDEKSYGPDHPNVAIRLTNLASLLSATNRLAEAIPMSRRGFEIFLAFTAQTGHEHPHLRAVLNNHSRLLIQSGRGEDKARAEIDALGEKYGVTLR